LAFVADAVSSAEPEGVVEVAVDGLGVVAARVEPGEVRIGGCDHTHVLGPVQLPGHIFRGAVEAHGDDPRAEVVGKPVVRAGGPRPRQTLPFRAPT
jgi:hypothetical protein